MLRLTLPNTPEARLAWLTAPALIILCAMLTYVVQPASGMTWNASAWSLTRVHPAVWVSFGVGFAAYLISLWIWVLKPAHPATRLFALSGLMTLLFTLSATESFWVLPPPDWLVGWLDIVNMVSASGFGIVMIALFLIYPNRLPFWRWNLATEVAVFGIWTLGRTFGPFKNYEAVQPITFTEMLGIILIGMWQIWSARDDPRQRAVALWLGASVSLGAGIFIAVVAAPLTFGMPLLVDPQYVFPSFLLIYAGLAVGLIRYRLFDLGSWAFQLIFHACAALIVLAADALLISAVSLIPGMALALSVLGMAFLYMPLRNYAWRRITQRGTTDESEIFRLVVEAALKPSGSQRAKGWEQLLETIYHPLEIATGTQSLSTAHIEAEGQELHLPAMTNSPALILSYPAAGRALFTQRDLTRVEQMIALMGYAEKSRNAYDRGVSEERTRIARDIHDNIGAQLLRALHSGATDRKDAMIRDTLADLRDVINNAQNLDHPFDLILADLRAETADRLNPHGIALKWGVDSAEADTESGAQGFIDAGTIHALRSLVREATSNTIKHAGASQVSVRISLDHAGLSLLIEDDGCGFDSTALRLGHGLDNMRARAESQGGAFSLTSRGAGTSLSWHIPLHFVEPSQ